MAFHHSIDRRAFLKALASTGVLAGTLPVLSRGARKAKNHAHWRNWSGNQTADPRAIHYPSTPDALAALLASTTGTLRAFAGSHSFSPLVPTPDTLISLEAFNGLTQTTGDTATFGAGTRIAQAGEQAWAKHLSLSNQPDINLQSLAGAIATSTHGTGRNLPSMSAQIDALTLMPPTGEARVLSANDGDLFQAACCNLGALGLVTEITLKTPPAYRLEEHQWTLGFDEAIDFVDRHKDDFRNIELFGFPLGGTAIIKTMSLTDNQQDLNLDQDDNNDLLESVSQLCMHAGWLTPMMQKAVTLFVPEQRRRGPAHRLYASRRTVLFNEMEYTVPADRGVDGLHAVANAFRDNDINVFFPIEYRYTAADNTLLSMFSDRPGASISVHQYYKQDYRPVFDIVEPLLLDLGGRPHWGKLHSLGAGQLRSLYPGFDTFLAARKKLDPHGRLLNAHLRYVLGVN